MGRVRWGLGETDITLDYTCHAEIFVIQGMSHVTTPALTHFEIIIVILGLDPRIHPKPNALLSRIFALLLRWILGSSPRMT